MTHFAGFFSLYIPFKGPPLFGVTRWSHLYFRIENPSGASQRQVPKLSEKSGKIGFDPFLTEHPSKLPQNHPKWRREGFQRHRTAYSSVLVEYQPVGIHSDPFMQIFIDFLDLVSTLRRRKIQGISILGLTKTKSDLAPTLRGRKIQGI